NKLRKSYNIVFRVCIWRGKLNKSFRIRNKMIVLYYFMRKIFGERLALFIEEMKEMLSKYPTFPKFKWLSSGTLIKPLIRKMQPFIIALFYYQFPLKQKTRCFDTSISLSF
ncbi:hypothetical protein MOD47_21165, partial [Bacillus inaquosorum]|uniref:hypothetical protein n=1 Tax=Bacillus inaquosorum TaxID=483913 RepID=UPI00227E9D3A